MRALLPPVLLAACALFSQPLWANSAATLQILDDCLAKLAPAAPNAPRTPAGIEELRPGCPELEHAIVESGLRDQLPEHWQQWLDRGAIDDLRWLMRRYQSPAPAAGPRVPTLYRVAQTLNQPQPRHGWWRDFKDWLRQLLLPPEGAGSSWLARWLSQASLSPLLARSLFYGLLGAALALALWIVWRELQAAGVGAGGARRIVERSSHAPAPAGARPLTLESVDAAPLREQPALLLRLLVQALVQSGRLHYDRSLTHRELGVRSTFDDPQQHGSFVRISLLAERALYGRQTPASTGPQPQSERALTDGRLLYAQLHRARADAP